MDFWGPYSGPSRRGSSQCSPFLDCVPGARQGLLQWGVPPYHLPSFPSPSSILSALPTLHLQNKSQSQIIFSSALFWGRMGGHAGKGLIPVAESGGLVGTLSATQHSLWGVTCPQSLWEPPVLSVLGGGLGALSVPWSQGDSQGCKPGKYWCYGTFHGAHCPGKRQSQGQAVSMEWAGPDCGGGSLCRGRWGWDGDGTTAREDVGVGSGPGEQEHRSWR